jgi:hypothetical protein
MAPAPPNAPTNAYRPLCYPKRDLRGAKKLAAARERFVAALKFSRDARLQPGPDGAVGTYSFTAPVMAET